MKRSEYSPINASIFCSSRAVPRVATTSAWVSPRVNNAEPWVRGSTLLRIVIGRTVRVSRPSMRGSPSRICERTILASRSNRMLPTSAVSGTVPPTDAASAASAALTSTVTSFSLAVRACLSLVWYASRNLASPKCATRAISASFFGAGLHCTSGLPPSRTKSWIALITAFIWSWP